jgi:hypothetical protein
MKQSKSRRIEVLWRRKMVIKVKGGLVRRCRSHVFDTVATAARPAIIHGPVR